MPAGLKKEASYELKGAPSLVRKAEGGRGSVYRFLGSTPRVDRSGDVVELAGWDLTGFAATGGPVLWNHDPDEPIGRAVATMTPTGLEFDVEFMPEDVNPWAARVERMVAGSWIRSCSVGFIPHEYSRNANGGATYTGQDLTELSITALPINIDALKKAMQGGPRVAPVFDEARLPSKEQRTKGVDAARVKAWMRPASAIQLTKAAPSAVRLVRKSMDQKKAAEIGTRLEAALNAMRPKDGKLDEAAYMAALKDVETCCAELKAAEGEKPKEGEAAPADPAKEPAAPPAEGAAPEGDQKPEDDPAKKAPGAKSVNAQTVKAIAAEVAAILAPQIKSLVAQSGGEGLYDGDDDENEKTEMLASVQKAAERGVAAALAGGK